MTATTEHQPKGSRIAVRLTADDEAVIRSAAAVAGATLTDFTVQAAVARAHDVLADRRVFLLDDAAWGEFQALLDRPPRPNRGLERLLATPSVFSDTD